jgi:predicted nucleotidyltransferase
MVSREDRQRIVDIGRRFNASCILLFGSSAREEADAPSRDIDLAVEGVPASRFFEFYGELMFALAKPVDLVDLSRRSKFTDLIRREGVPLHV